MNNRFWRFIFTIVSTAIAALIGWSASDRFLELARQTNLSNTLSGSWVRPTYMAVFVAAGLVFGVALGRTLFIKLELLGERVRSMSTRDKLAIGAGLTLGIILTVALSVLIFQATRNNAFVAIPLTVLLGVIVTYLTMSAAVSMKEEFRIYMPPQPEDEAPPKENFKVLDTNVIIDGRIAEVARTGFLQGPLYVPGFVLEELQHIADSADGLKRARGRRGLDILNEMKKELNVQVRTFDKLVPGNDEVDSRLVRLAKALNGQLVTNDFNLNKVAELQGVTVLNINELANALRPVVLPGEEMRVLMVKEGKEYSQGVGYLDDGTMIVVEGGKKHIGETVEIVVNSLLQTTAGKMIFARMRDDEDGEDYGQGVRSYTGGGARRPVRGRRE
jgi:uncharacterized protein YacL